MISDNDPLHPKNFLEPGERLLWTGRPAGNAPPGAALKIVRIAGWVVLACFVVFAAIGWANRADLDGAGGLLAGFLALSLFGGLFLLWGIPAITRRGLRQTRYGVTAERVMIVHGMQGPRVNILRVRPEAEIETRPTARGLADVVFGREVDMLYTPGVPTTDPQQRTPILRLLKFEALPEAEAQAAAAALDRIRGKGGEGPIHEVRPV